MSSDIIDEPLVLSELARELQTHYGQRLAEIVLFGSRARGDADDGSDYDVMVVLRGNVDRKIERQVTKEIVHKLCRKHDVLIICHFVALDRYKEEQSPLMMNVRKEGVLV